MFTVIVPAAHVITTDPDEGYHILTDEAFEWIEENCVSGWEFHDDQGADGDTCVFRFKSETEAVMFKLRWA